MDKQPNYKIKYRFSDDDESIVREYLCTPTYDALTHSYFLMPAIADKSIKILDICEKMKQELFCNLLIKGTEDKES
mgnify:CR=1 FL=1